MKHNVEFKGFDQKDSSEREAKILRLIEEKVSRLDKRVERFTPDEVFLRVLVESFGHKNYDVSLTFEVPRKTLAAKEDSRELESAIRGAFAEIERQFEAYRTTMRGEPDWKRVARRAELRRKKIEAVPDEADTESFFALINPHLNELEEFARHMVAYAEARGDLARDELTPEELVDETLVRAYREFAKDPARGEIRRWLTQLAAEQLEAEIKKSRFERNHVVYTEETVPETPPTEEVSTIGEETLYFYQPDQVLKLEDAIPDLKVPTPEEDVERKEVRQCLQEALATMPRQWRRILLLRYVDGLTGAELAKAAGMAEPEIERLLGYAREYLRHRLIEAGCALETTTGRKSSNSDAERNRSVAAQ